jgi:hypothetical protein
MQLRQSLDVDCVDGSAYELPGASVSRSLGLAIGWKDLACRSVGIRYTFFLDDDW